LLLPGSFAHHGIVDASGLEEGQIGSFASVKIEEKLVAMKWKRPSGLSGCLQRSCFIRKLLLIFVGIFNPLFYPPTQKTTGFARGAPLRDILWHSGDPDQGLGHGCDE
jgi:hypothetical protein